MLTGLTKLLLREVSLHRLAEEAGRTAKDMDEHMRFAVWDTNMHDKKVEQIALDHIKQACADLEVLCTIAESNVLEYIREDNFISYCDRNSVLTPGATVLLSSDDTECIEKLIDVIANTFPNAVCQKAILGVDNVELCKLFIKMVEDISHPYQW